MKTNDKVQFITEGRRFITAAKIPVQIMGKDGAVLEVRQIDTRRDGAEMGQIKNAPGCNPPMKRVHFYVELRFAPALPPVSSEYTCPLFGRWEDSKSRPTFPNAVLHGIGKQEARGGGSVEDGLVRWAAGIVHNLLADAMTYVNARDWSIHRVSNGDNSSPKKCMAEEFGMTDVDDIDRVYKGCKTVYKAFRKALPGISDEQIAEMYEWLQENYNI